jgi:hypothetical protein
VTYESTTEESPTLKAYHRPQRPPAFVSVHLAGFYAKVNGQWFEAFNGQWIRCKEPPS